MNDNDAASKRGPRLKLVAPGPPPVPCQPVEPSDQSQDGDGDDDDLLAFEDSPYSALLRADLPDDLRTQALHGLWRGTFGGGGDDDGV